MPRTGYDSDFLVPDLWISPRPWLLPFHPHCECAQLPIIPGAEAPIEFRSAGGLAAAMPVGGQVEFIGPLNWLIRSAGLVSWEDLSQTGGDPRDFGQVIRRNRLAVPQFVALSWPAEWLGIVRYGVFDPNLAEDIRASCGGDRG